MGGVPLLLMAVAMGITYGWKPDGDGGVDYIIQIPPEQVDDIRRSGTVSSVIDPSIRGHVSRVIIKVGKEPLARVTPNHIINERSRVITAAHDSHDAAPLPVPELDSPGAAPAKNVLLKPDAGDPGRGPGLGLPSSLQGTAGTPASQGSALREMSALTADLAQRTRNQTNTGADNGKMAMPSGSDRTSNALRSTLPPQNPSLQSPPGNQSATGQIGRSGNRQIPPFTGQGAGDVARVRTGGPTTAPANARDKQWFQLNGRANQNGPSTEPIDKAAWPPMVGPPDLRQQPGAAEASNTASNRRTQPIGSTATFARIPDGLNVTSANQPAPTSAPTMSIAEYQRAQYEQQQLQQRQQQLQQRQQQQRTTQPAASEVNFPSRRTTGNVNPASERVGIGTPGNSLAQPGIYPPSQTRPTVDPRLSAMEAARLPLGAWSRDSYGNPIDRDGRVLDQYGRPVSAQRAYDLTLGRIQSPSHLDRTSQPHERPVSRIDQTGFANQTSLGPPADPRISQRGAGGVNQRSTPPPTNSASDRLSSDRLSREYVQGSSALSKNRQSLAAQPLFNGLLLMSIVANVYLIFWLKNLRHQFRDLVASKRATTSEVAA